MGRGWKGGLAFGAAALFMLCAVSAAPAQPLCARYASASAAPGSGTLEHPYNRITTLAGSLSAGQTGCLLPGTFTETVDLNGLHGTAASPTRIVSVDPANRAVLAADRSSAMGPTLRFAPNTSNFEVAGLAIRGAPTTVGAPTVVVGGTGNRLVDDDITNGQGAGTCVVIGLNTMEPATNAVLDGVAVHGCGVDGGSSQSNGIGVSEATGTVITDSYVYGSRWHGIELYPDAQGSRIERNVIDGQANGMGGGLGIQFGSAGTTSSNGNLVRANVISNNESAEVGSNWDGPVGTGNSVTGNCLFHPSDPARTIEPGSSGFSADSTNSTDPLFTDRAHPPQGFALLQGSPCAAHGPQPVPLAVGHRETVDPEARNVFTEVLLGTVDARAQGGSYQFVRNGTAVDGGSLAPLPLPQDVTSKPLSAFKPSTTYQFRVDATNGGYTVHGPEQSFTTRPAPPLTPPIPTVAFSTEGANRRGIKLTRISAKLPKGTKGATVSCRGKGCPISNRRPLSNRRLLLHRRFGPGTTIEVRAPLRSNIGRFVASSVIWTVVRSRHGKPVTTRTDSPCVTKGGALATCMRMPYTSTPTATRKKNRFTAVFARLTATAVPIGATLSMRCLRGRCIRLSKPSCLIFDTRSKTVNLLHGKARARTMGAGATLEIRITKPDTVGIVRRIKILRSGHVSASYAALPAGAKGPKVCPSA